MSRTFKVCKLKKSEPFPGAGEGNLKKYGQCKSFKFHLISKKSSKQDRDNYQKMLIFLEDMNDLRFEISQRIKTIIDDGERKGVSPQKALNNFLISLWKANDYSYEEEKINRGKISKNDFILLIKEITKGSLEKSNNYKKYKSSAMVSKWISHDLGGKIGSYLELYDKASKDRKSLFSDEKEDDQIIEGQLDSEIISQITGMKTYKKWQKKDFYKWCLKKAREDLGEKVLTKGILEIEDTGKIKKIVGERGVEKHNILINYMNIFIGQYKGQKTCKAIKRFVQTHKLDLKINSCRGVYKWIKEQGSKVHKEEFNNLKQCSLLELKRIKNYPSFPNFRKTETYKNFKSIKEEKQKKVLGYIDQFKELKLELEKYSYSKDQSLKRKLHIDSQKDFTKDFLKEKYRELCEKQERRVRKKYSYLKGQDTDLPNNYLLSLGLSSVAGEKRLLRRIKYDFPDLEKAFQKELQYCEKKIDELSKNLSKENSRLSVGKLKALSQYMGSYLRLLLDSKKIGNDSKFERSYFQEKISRLTGELQMEGLKIKPYERFSFQFRNFDQAGVYPVVEEEENGKNRFSFCLNFFKNKNSSEEKIEYKCLFFKDGKRGAGKREVQKIVKEFFKGEYIKLPIVFPKRTGRKFLFHHIMGIKTTKEGRERVIKLGTPNFIVTYKKGKNEPLIEGSMSIEKEEFRNNILIYPGKLKKEEKAEFLLKNSRYLIGVDRGENKLFSYTVWDEVEKRIVAQGSIGDKFKEAIDSLKNKEAESQRRFKVSEYKKIRRKIGNVLKGSVDDAINQLLLLSFKYRDNEKTTAFIFEYLDPKFSRKGSKAYVELRQMNALIEKVKEARNYYNMPFQIYEIGPKYTSQICSQCGRVDKKSREGESYKCIHCGHKADADLQASYNILHKWIARKKREISQENNKLREIGFLSVYLKELKTCACLKKLKTCA